MCTLFFCTYSAFVVRLLCGWMASKVPMRAICPLQLLSVCLLFCVDGDEQTKQMKKNGLPFSQKLHLIMYSQVPLSRKDTPIGSYCDSCVFYSGLLFVVSSFDQFGIFLLTERLNLLYLPQLQPFDLVNVN